MTTAHDAALRADAEAILRAAIAGADPGPRVREAILRATWLADATRIHVIAIGKASRGMAHDALAVLPRAPDECIIVAPDGPDGNEAGVIIAAHPLPDERSLAAGRAVATALERAGDGDAVIVLLSGGASALCVLPVSGVGIPDYAACTAALLRAGAPIHELNAVRRAIDRLKGGGMARLAAPARVLGLVLSDVVGDRIDVIASGPLTPAPRDVDAREVLGRYGINGLASIVSAVERESTDVDAAGRTGYGHVAVQIVGSNADAVSAAARCARELGYEVRLLDAPVMGEAREAGARIASLAASVRSGASTCILGGGETTVTVRGSGRGGRNQEVVLGALLALADEAGSIRNIAVGSIGTDGIDGATDAAGAVITRDSLDVAARLGLDARAALDANDSGTLLERIGATIRTGPTGTNVMDVQVALVGPRNVPASIVG